jgi:hypothetical protein
VFKWEDLSLLQKLLFWFAIVVVAVIAPELALLVHFGGIELAFAFLVVYFKPLLTWLVAKYAKLQDFTAISGASIRGSASMSPKVFFTQGSFCMLAIVVTGSVTFSLCFFIPALLLNTALI